MGRSTISWCVRTEYADEPPLHISPEVYFLRKHEAQDAGDHAGIRRCRERTQAAGLISHSYKVESLMNDFDWIGRPQPVQNFGIPFEGFDKIVFFVLDATVRGHIDIVDFHQRRFRSLPWLCAGRLASVDACIF